ncbi:hypothetical protein A1Q2_00653 [Trichosporon asahii var. asahii CBS 8904]|uniref:Uncharacterized protein n=1 Tax=Trichosporon asahii var. asahii (strain CBS 8904) TaxID=1220162 RepID=K1VX08_TRIAC|nr:hypothetical protein A1Q2_00653 [Trichosporon asahii var. asahii CBS 8904]
MKFGVALLALGASLTRAADTIQAGAPEAGTQCSVPLVGLPMSSPQIHYEPSFDEGWEWSAREGEATSNGYLQYPRIKTSHVGAQLQYAFVGNGARLNGTASPGSSLTMRLEHLKPDTNAHATTTVFPEGLTDAILFETDTFHSTGDWMRITFQVVSGTFEFNRIEYSALRTCNANAPQGEDVILDSITTGPTQPYTLAGEWRGMQRDPTVAPGSDRAQSLIEAKPGGVISFAAPPKAAYMHLNGMVAKSGGDYEVEISPPPPGPDDGSTASRKYAGSTKRPYASLQPLWEGQLKSDQQYNVTLRNTDPSAVLQVYSVRIVSEGDQPKPLGAHAPYSLNETFVNVDAKPSDPSSPGETKSETQKGTNVGAIVGGVVGGVLGAILLGLLGWWLWRKCHAKDPFDDDASIVDVADQAAADALPYPQHPNMSQLTQFHSTGSFGMSSASASYGTASQSQSFATLPRALTPEGTGASYGTHGYSYSASGSDATSAMAVASHSASFPALPRSSFSSRHIPGSPLSNLPPISTQSTGEMPPLSPLPNTPYSPGIGPSYTPNAEESLTPPIPAAVAKTPRQVPRPRSRQPSRRLVETEDTVPPSYDPTWADDFVDGQQYLEPAIASPRTSGQPPLSPISTPPAAARATPPLPTPPIARQHGAGGGGAAGSIAGGAHGGAAGGAGGIAGGAHGGAAGAGESSGPGAEYGSQEGLATPPSSNAPLAAHAIPPSPPSPGTSDENILSVRPTSPAHSDFNNRR